MLFLFQKVEIIGLLIYNHCARGVTTRRQMKLLITEQKESDKELRVCQNMSCGMEFYPNTHNQKYCDEHCCKIATNKKIMDRYYQKQAIKKGLKRVCSNEDCDTILSRYNDMKLCSVCSRIEEKFDLDYLI